MSIRVKIEVYLTREHKGTIKKKAKKADFSLSDYVRLKALDMLKNEKSKD